VAEDEEGSADELKPAGKDFLALVRFYSTSDTVAEAK